MSDLLQNQITMNINEAAELVGVSAGTIRNWEKAGLIAPNRHNNRYRVFTMTNIDRLKQIKELSIDQKMNLSAIRSLLDKDYSGLSPLKEQSISKRMLGDKWKKHRVKKGLSVTHVAEQVGISPSYLSKIENSQANASIDILKRLSEFYGENILYYYEEDDSVEPIRSTGKTEKFTIGLEGVVLSARSTLRDSNLKVMTYTIEPQRGRMEANTHHGEEFIYIL